MRNLDLNRLWAGAGRGLLIAVAGWIGGCASEDITPPMDMQLEQPDLSQPDPVDTFDSFDSPLCVPDGYISGRKTLSIQGLAPVRVVDSLELRDVRSRGMTMGWDTTSVETIGTPCATATDRTKCQNDVAARMPMDGFSWIYAPLGSRKYSYLVTTQGDSVAVIGDMAGVKDFLGPIDTPQEALFWVPVQKDPMWPTFRISCTGKAAGAIHEVADGYQVVAYTVYYPTYYQSIYYQHLLHVSRLGDVTVIQTKNLPPAYCVGCY